MSDYANLHHYDFIIDMEANNQRGLMWHKFDMVQRVINGSQHDWVWWIDFDTLVMNHKIKVENIIADALAEVSNPDKIDFLFTPDWYAHDDSRYI
jgi:mannan polymerase II complex MNN10 subunit